LSSLLWIAVSLEVAVLFHEFHGLCFILGAIKHILTASRSSILHLKAMLQFERFVLGNHQIHS